MSDKLTTAQFTWLRWLEQRGGSAYLEGHRLIAQGEPNRIGSEISFLNLLVKGALEIKDRRIVISDYGRRLLTP